jgi:hypothetical protein
MIKTIEELSALFNELDLDATVMAAIVNGSATTTDYGGSPGYVTTRAGDEVMTAQKAVAEIVGSSITELNSIPDVNTADAGPATDGYLLSWDNATVNYVLSRPIPLFVLNGATATQITADYTVLTIDLSGGVYYEVNSASDIVITVNSAMADEFPITFERIGTGLVTFVDGAGVTIASIDSAMTIGSQYGAVTLIPKGSDVYSLIGNIA